jgi:hypothetical protein
MTDERVYDLFFSQVARLDDLENQPSSNPASKAQDYVGLYLQRRLHVTPGAAEEVKEIALRLRGSLAMQDAHARELRTKRHVELQTSREQNLPIPPRPAELAAIPVQRTAAILAARDQLRATLGNDAFMRLDSRLKTKAPQRVRAADASGRDISQEERIAGKNRLVYRAFLHEVVGFDAQASKERALGLLKTADSVRTEVQRLAGLSDQQARIVEEVATDYGDKLAPVVQQYRELRGQYGRQWLALSATGKSVSENKELGDAKDKAKQTRGKIDALTDSAIRQLQQRLGDEVFSQLDTFVKQRVKRLPPPSLESSANAATPKLEATR